MAKGNIILGYLRGSIGDITFYRAKGQQMSRARNRQPANPRTEPQMATRSRLANAVKFFRQVDTGFFKYAFEDRKNNESDYNAFMRHNLQESGYIGAQASKIFSWPALGIWQMSEGTLPEIGAPFPQPQDAGTSIYFDLGVTLDDSTSTVANLSNLLVNGNRNVWRSGDIVTVVIYRATNRATLPTIDVTESHEASCGVVQFRINTSDQRDLNDLTVDVGGVTYALGYDSEGFFIYGLDSAGATAWANDYLGFSVIHTRNTDKGLKVSRSYLASPSWEIAVIAGSQSTQYYQDVLADWGAASTAILQGGLIEAYAPAPPEQGEVVAGYGYNLSTQTWTEDTLGKRMLGTKTGGTDTLRLKCVNGENITNLDFRSTGKQCSFVFRKTTDYNPPADCYDLLVTYPAFTSGEEINVYFGDTLIVTFY